MKGSLATLSDYAASPSETAVAEMTASDSVSEDALTRHYSRPASKHVELEFEFSGDPALLDQNYRIYENEFKRVGQIQRTLLPNPLTQIPGLKIATSFETFGEAGGDLYDFIPLGKEQSEREPWAVFIGDASGHGPSAAVVIAIVQALLHAHPPGVTSPAALRQHLNDHLCRRPIQSSFVTAFIAVYEPSSPQLMFASAGHPPPLLMGAMARTVTCLDSGRGFPLGIYADQIFQEASIELEHGDALLLYTDGIQEARDHSDSMFGLEGVQTVMRGCFGAPQQLVTTIRQAVINHEKGRRAADDQTLVAIGVL
jgi:sigma-B regulation protein RsbU (phosphoserine phosphatase)